MITFCCPGCQATFKLPDELTGKTARCSKCNQRFTVPAEASKPAVAAAPAPVPVATSPKKVALKPVQEVLEAEVVEEPSSKPFDDVEVVAVVDKVEVVEEETAIQDPPRRRIPASIARNDDDDDDSPRRRRRRSKSGSSTGIIVGSIVGGLVFVAILVVVIVLLVNRSGPVNNPPPIIAVNNPPVNVPNNNNPPGANNKANPAPAGNQPGIILDRQEQLTRTDGFDSMQRNCRAKRYSVQLEANRNYTIDMISNDPLGVFDPFLRLELNGVTVAQDDDSGDGEWDARIFFRPPQTGQYIIVATTFIPQQTGSFRLVVRAQ